MENFTIKYARSSQSDKEVQVKVLKINYHYKLKKFSQNTRKLFSECMNIKTLLKPLSSLRLLQEVKKLQ